MKASEIQVGVEYGVAQSSSPSDTQMQRFVVAEITQERVRNRSTYGSRTATVVKGTVYDRSGSGFEATYLPQFVHATWAEVQERLQRRREHLALARVEQAAREDRRKPLVTAYAVARVEAGLSPLSNHGIEALVERGKVDMLSIEDLTTLLAAAEAKGYLQAQMNFSTEI